MANDNENKDSKKNQKIKVVQGNGKIDISPVYNHLDVQKPKTKEKKEIIIPKEKK